MNLIFVWAITYAVPGIAAGSIIKLLPARSAGLSKRNIFIMHGALLISALASQYAIYSLGFIFPWVPNEISIYVFIASVFLALAVVGSVGVWYGLSVLLQQSAMLLMAYILLPTFPVYLVILLVVPIFIFCHTLQTGRWLIRGSLFVFWGIISILLFSITHNIWLIAALHTLGGALLIKNQILYSEVV